jgi:Type IV secretion-system coupling protein DNA-binding domain
MPDHKVAPYDHDHENEVTLFGETNFRNQNRRFGIKTDDRRRHMYVVGKTGMGKTTFLEQLAVSDINAGHGIAFIDPHGDSAEKLLDFIPPHRINDVVYFNPADMEFPVGFNILEVKDETQKHLVAAGLMGVFKKIWPDVWSARMEYILLNTVLALIDYPGSTLLGINRLLADEEYRLKVIALIQDPVVKAFWVKEFASFSEKYRTEAIAPVQNKVGQFLSATIIRNIVAQVKSTIDVREIMDTRKIFIVNLSKGRIGEENARLLGAMIITRIQLSAMERVDMPEKERQDFYLYVDEFQNFATESFANILSEARKYRLSLMVAHQYIEQLEEEVRDAVFGNVGTLVAFRVGAADAAYMENEFMPRFTPEDLVNLTKFQIYLKLMIDGAASEPFSANTLPPIAQEFGTREKVIKVSRERYASVRKTVEEKVIKWAGYGTADTGQTIKTEDEMDAEEREIQEKIKELEASSPDVGEMAVPAGGGGFGGEKKKKKALFQIPCAVCGKLQDLTFEPDWSKPWLCKEHLDAKKAGTLPRGIKLRPAIDFKAGPDGALPPASMAASAAAPSATVAPQAAPVSRPAAPTQPAPAPRPSVPAVPKPPAPMQSAPVASPVSPAPRPAAVVSPAAKPIPLASLVGAVPAAPKTVRPSTVPDKTSRHPARGAAAPSPVNQPKPKSRPPEPKQRGPAPPPGSQIQGGPVIAMQSHKPRIVVSTGADDEKDVLLAPKKDDKPADPSSGTLQPGQVIKF